MTASTVFKKRYQGTGVGATSDNGVVSLIVKATTGFLHVANYYNRNAATRYLMIFDSATQPADTAKPVMTVKVATGATGSIDYGQIGRPFANGICLVNSTQDGTLVAGTTDGDFDATFG